MLLAHIEDLVGSAIQGRRYSRQCFSSNRASITLARGAGNRMAELHQLRFYVLPALPVSILLGSIVQKSDAPPTKTSEAGRRVPGERRLPYELPEWVKAGTLARLISFDHGYWTVEAEGKVFITKVESGWLYELNGRWLEADDPRVIARKKETRLRASPAYSAVNGEIFT